MLHTNSMRQCYIPTACRNVPHKQHASLKLSSPSITCCVLACLVWSCIGRFTSHLPTALPCTYLAHHEMENVSIIISLLLAYCWPWLFCIQSKPTFHKYLLPEDMTDVLLCVMHTSHTCRKIPLLCCQLGDFKIPCQSCTVCSIAVSCSPEARFYGLGLNSDL